MKIDGTSMSPIGSVQAVNRVSQVQKKTLGSEDKVAVSDKAQVFQALLQKAKELPSVREDRVKALTEQIERGEFQIDGQKIAEKLFSPEF
ncbi:flagellar biosynthesis anti-sigma factor FlgM [Desulfosporosinus sp. BICA1-9]|uniref:flagellar biosynthesis anti-sigma factor FlgM n=1 Tax=Desulfosporosinus sp. BICA1-9 TaxID=1531958 RepID=UPI00054B2B51|nr:flagellar biosynthesis anti-sigma factor FlgM [Desulfosporosinus sp. BICA1-9]KJS50244.1 MAG: flagellar biosynthesis anti-sigma factor FlgM [Peptococcaceae bacterium BRH_c23]KJS86780.1 MAG: flagellar biosynthesis anti-sigma factor FlgM [Desulfosporosinus sp. BICA1-9]HBW36488.1 flagellar biosynthesis anti-sigma factor FlgM [Desulfosporosinus sp.]